jgi:hypothetical protein
MPDLILKKVQISLTGKELESLSKEIQNIMFKELELSIEEQESKYPLLFFLIGCNWKFPSEVHNGD